MSKVLVFDCNGYDDPSFPKIIDNILDFSSIIFEGKSVFLKPNMLSAVKPERGVTTHPVFIREIIRSLKSRGAKKILVGDNPGMTGYGASEKVGRISGIMEAAGDCFINISAEGIIKNIAGRQMLVSKQILESDIVINLPRLKTHMLTGFTGAIKNMFGIVIGSDKFHAHRDITDPDKFSAFMADVCKVRPPELSILDAIFSMEGNGPSGGKLIKTGKILVSCDPVALDGVALSMIRLSIDKVAMIKRAEELGIGSIANTSIEGNLSDIRKFKLPVTMKLGAGFIESIVNRFGMSIYPDRIPAVTAKKCTGCGQCKKICPAEAITMIDKKPVINRKKCISCFCCIEICTENAMKPKIKWY